METLPLVGIVDDPEPWEEYPLASPEATLTVQEEWLWEKAYREEMPAGVMFFEQAEPLEPVYYSYLYHWPSPSPDLSYDLEVLNKHPFDIDDDDENAYRAAFKTNPRKKRLDREYMRAVEDWTPRMKREYLREQRRAPKLPYGPIASLERINVPDPSPSTKSIGWLYATTSTNRETYTRVYETHTVPTPPSEDDTRASTLPEKTAAERAWDWWEEPPYLSWTEEEPPDPSPDSSHL